MVLGLVALGMMTGGLAAVVLLLLGQGWGAALLGFSAAGVATVILLAALRLLFAERRQRLPPQGSAAAPDPRTPLSANAPGERQG